MAIPMTDRELIAEELDDMFLFPTVMYRTESFIRRIYGDFGLGNDDPRFRMVAQALRARVKAGKMRNARRRYPNRPSLWGIADTSCP
jgi:hypothetical protein